MTFLKRKKIMLLLFAVLVATSVLVSPIFVHAALEEPGFWDNVLSYGLGILGTIGDWTIGLAFRFIAWIFFLISGWFAIAASGFLDAAIEFSLNTGHLTSGAVKTGWEVFRDLANMTFIFILLYIALATILQIPNFNTKRILMTLIIAALLVNFSFFLTGIVIDASNLLAKFFYETMTTGRTDGLGGIFNEELRLSETVREGARNLSNVGIAVTHLLGGASLLVAGFVFLSGALLFVIRSIVLMFLLILAPVAFVAAILPKTKNYWNMWLSKLVHNAFVAPVYLLLISIVIAITRSDDFVIATGATDLKTHNLASAFGFFEQGSNYVFATYAPTVLYFAIVIGLLIAAVFVAKQISSGAATLSVKWAGAGVGLAAGAAGLAYRQTAGRGFHAFGQYVKKTDAEGRPATGVGRWAASENIAKRYAARLTMRGAAAGAKASGDVRADSKTGKIIRGVTGLTTAGAALGGVGARPDVGRASGKGGRAAEEKRKAERQAEVAGTLGSEEAQRAYFRDIERRTPTGAYRALRARTEQKQGSLEMQTAQINLKTAQEKAKQVKRQGQMLMQRGGGTSIEKESFRKEQEAARNALKTAQAQVASVQSAMGPYSRAEHEEVERRLNEAGVLREKGVATRQMQKILEEMGYKSEGGRSRGKDGDSEDKTSQ